MNTRWRGWKQQRSRDASLAHRVVAVLAVVALSFGFVGLTASASQAATPGIDIAVLHNGTVVGDDAVIPEGDDITLRVQYDAAADIAGKQITITLPAGITVAGGLPSNDAIESAVENGDGTFTVTFKDPIPDGITEGAFAIQLKAGQVDGDTESPIIWNTGDDDGGVTIIVEDKVTPPVEITDSYNKAVNPNNLDGFVVTSGTPDYTFEGLKPEIADQVLTYTLVLSSAEARSGYSLTDELAAGLGFVTGSFAAQLTTADGTIPFTFEPTVTGNSFSGTVEVPAQSTLRITYQVQVTDIAALEALLQAQFEARNDSPGNYEITLPNDAVFGGEQERSVSVRLRGNIPGVGIGTNFAKTGNWTLRDVVTNEGGTLQPAAEMTYTLRANLTPWDGRNANFVLGQNVVVSDTLIDQAAWNTGADFISVSGSGPISSLTEATGFDGTAAQFASDEYVGQYALVGQTLFVNVGKDNTTDVSIQVKAQLNTIDGLTGSDNTTVIDGMYYPWNNRAQFHYRDGDPVNRDHNAGVVVLPADYESGVNDSAAFNKTAQDAEVRVTPGESAQVPYRFDIDTSKANVDPLTSRIIDELNTDIFDISDLDSIPVTGSYGGQALTREHFALSTNDDGRLVIELSTAGKTLVGSLPEGQKWVINIVFTTILFEGKKTYEIYNRATLQSDDSDWDYWSDEDSEATSYGDEAELRKRVYDTATGEWTSARDAAIQDGVFVDDRFIYSIELIPRGNYGEAFPVSIFPREDVLPDSVDFLGFVGLDQNGVPNLDSLSSDAVDINGNVIASYADGVVTIRQQNGTSLNPNQGRIVTYFAVRANDASGAIVNTIAGSDAVITPVGDPSIDIEKWNDEGEAPAYDESGALTNDGYDGDFDTAPGKPLKADEALPINFTISNSGRENLVDVVVSDELEAGKGEIQDLTCTFPDASTGTEWAGPFLIGTQFACTGTLPALQTGDTHADLAQVTGVGVTSRGDVADEDAWNAYVPTPSVDIEKWNDQGEAPAYDESGALTNDGYDGDFDTAPGKKLKAGDKSQIHFTISNDGNEDLIGIVVSDELTDGNGEIQDLVCTFTDGSTGTTWDGPLTVGSQFECTGTLSALVPAQSHSDRATVTATGLHSGTAIDDADDWHGFTEAAPVTPVQSGLAMTGVTLTLWIGGTAILLLVAGGVMLIARRRHVTIDSNGTA
ncbi:hypothetical protein [Cryobacterium sp. PH29-G1]|uniref:hypothetical protein n=1 Tax=Cryobacterium sp. PH29-G1 TaxID=3046211 RepID=UPI0024B98A87|nr:hypothetical protein [Cryobacterium sp. PH29-G1]MDJ0350673.1 hypothetical protein [Cryobacterium sp. PH29-G1]